MVCVNSGGWRSSIHCLPQCFSDVEAHHHQTNKISLSFVYKHSLWLAPEGNSIRLLFFPTWHLTVISILSSLYLSILQSLDIVVVKKCIVYC